MKKNQKKVLLIDADPQGNATTGMGIAKNATKGLYDVLMRDTPIGEVIQHTAYGDVIPSNKELAAATVELISLIDEDEQKKILGQSLAPIKDEYDYILIDCPPTLEILSINAFTASDSVLIPVQCEFYALQGLVDLTTSIRSIKHAHNPRLQLEGIVLTMYDKRLSLSSQVAEDVEAHFRDGVFKTYIPRNVRIAEAPSHGKPILAYDKLSKGAKAYEALAKEFLKQEHVIDI